MVEVAVIATVRNERSTIDGLLTSLFSGRRAPEEVIIVDAGSTDGTWEALQRWAARTPRARALKLPGCGRSAGRNLAIRATTLPWIAVTDGGVTLDPGWLEALVRPVEARAAPTPDVVAGFFRMAPRTLFELALGVTTLPSAAEIRPERFLPSSRSVLFSRRAWEAAGGYPEWLDYGEDLVFDLMLRRAGARFVWAPEAMVHFRPRSSVAAFFRQYYLYARGDGKALLWSRRHAVRYTSYALLALLLGAVGRWWRRPPSLAATAMIAGGAALYLRVPFWRYSQGAGERGRVTAAATLGVYAWIPVLRVTGDVAKMLGYPVGRAWRWRHRRDIPVDPTAPLRRLSPPAIAGPAISGPRR